MEFLDSNVVTERTERFDLRDGEFFALAVVCRGIRQDQEAGPGFVPDRSDAINAIHGRFGAQVALLQSLIPRTVVGP